MTTKNPRLTITLQPTIAAQLKEISRLTGNSQSSLIADLLDGSAEVFSKVIQVLTAAEGAKQSLKGKITEDLDAAQGRLEGQLGLVLEEFDGVTRSLIDDMEAIKRRSRKAQETDAQAPSTRQPARPSTPLSNRGVRSDPIATKIIAQTPSRVRSKPATSRSKIRGVV